jgi:hypothetical protein
MNEKKVFILKTEHFTYPDPPFNPPDKYPELEIDVIDKENTIYALVRDALYGLGMDRGNYGTPNWDPFGELVRPGDKVVLKPNLVLDWHEDGEQGVSSMITHASILRPVIDYVLKASKGTARITVCDAPVQSASWDKIIMENHYQHLVEFYKDKGLDIELLDLKAVLHLLRTIRTFSRLLAIRPGV